MDLIGKQLGQYRLLRELSQGGTATIYLAEHTILFDEVAVKVLIPEFSQNSEVIERFHKEAAAIKKLSHPHIIPVKDFGVYNKNTYYLVMAYIPNGDLHTRIENYAAQDRLMPVAEWLPLLKQIAAALDHAHSRGIIHRDIKPQNILIEGNDVAYLTDFGLMLDVDQGSLGTAFGTPRYIAPEQARGSQPASPQSDIYSLCVIVYELLTGTPLFAGDDVIQVARAHIRTNPTSPRQHNPYLPDAVAAVIMKSLDKEPSQRHTTVTAFLDALEAAFGGETAIHSFDDRLSAYRPPAAEPARENIAQRATLPAGTARHATVAMKPDPAVHIQRLRDLILTNDITGDIADDIFITLEQMASDTQQGKSAALALIQNLLERPAALPDDLIRQLEKLRERHAPPDTN